MRRRVIIPAAVSSLALLVALMVPVAGQDATRPDTLPVTPVSAPLRPEKSDSPPAPDTKPAEPAAAPASAPPADPAPSPPTTASVVPKPEDIAPAPVAAPAPRSETPAGAGTPSEAAPASPAAADGPKPETPAAPVVGEPAAPLVAEPATIAQPPPPAFQLDIAAAAQKSGPKSGFDKRETDAIVAFYTARQNAPLWHAETGRTPSAEALLAEIGRGGDFGLDTAPLDTALAKAAPSADASPDQRATDELRITQAFLRYARQARGGRISDPSSLSAFLDRRPVLYDPASLLSQVATAADPAAYLRQLHPQHLQFEKLRRQYLGMRRTTPTGATLPTIPDGPRIRPGQSHAHVALVRQRLDLTAKPGEGSRHDEALVAAIKEFQVAKGLRPADGSIGNGTRAALNGVVQGNPKKVLANMEQWRWMPDDLGRFYVWVNIPEYTMRIVQDGKVIHTERVIVGKTDTQTPVFSDEMEQVIFHPFWGVPDGIKSNEIQPGLARGNFGVLTKHNLRIASGGRDIDPASVNWQTTDLRRFQVYQPPGNDNVLGVVKFRFPNKHDVYMHDTPTKGLFNTAVRTYSHGCMRVQNPVRFAEILLAEDKKMAADRVRTLAAPGSPPNNAIGLSRRIPVHITYFTAAVEDDGKARYFPDVYGHETRINLALEGKAHLIPKPDPKAPPVSAEPVASLKETTKGPRDWVRNVFINN